MSLRNQIEKVLKQHLPLPDSLTKQLLDIADDWDEKEKTCIRWCAEDVQDRARYIGYQVPDDQEAQDIMEEVIGDMDCNYGVTWDHIDMHLRPYEDEELITKNK